MNTMAKLDGIFCALAFGTVLTGCSSLTPTYETQEAYIVIDGEGTPSPAKTEKLLKDITSAMKSHVSSVQASRSIPPNPLPKQPGNFSVEDPTGGKGFGAIAHASGLSLRMPKCETSILNLRSDDRAQAQYGQTTRFFVCVMPYTKGFRTVVYASHAKASGGISAGTLGGMIGGMIVGDTSQFIPRVMDEVKRGIELNLSGVKIVQSYIPESFSGPMIDKRSDLQASKN